MEHFMDYRTIGDQEYYISTANTFDKGWETMVFTSKDGDVTDWGEKYQKLYYTEEQAKKGHAYAVNHLEECLNNYKNKCWDEDEL